jgi:hypothetical protein
VLVAVGHNVKNFDAKHFLPHIENNNMHDDSCCIIGFSDTLHFFKIHQPKLPGGFNQKNLVNTFLPEFQYRAHDAIHDVLVLSALQMACKFSNHIQQFSFTKAWVVKHKSYQLHSKQRDKTLAAWSGKSHKSGFKSSVKNIM